MFAVNPPIKRTGIKAITDQAVREWEVHLLGSRLRLIKPIETKPLGWVKFEGNKFRLSSLLISPNLAACF